MIEQKDLAGSLTLPGNSMTLNRMGYGAMQLAGPGVRRFNELTSRLIRRAQPLASCVRRQSW